MLPRYCREAAAVVVAAAVVAAAVLVTALPLFVFKSEHS